jgi:hypothetical protein
MLASRGVWWIYSDTTSPAGLWFLKRRHLSSQIFPTCFAELHLACRNWQVNFIRMGGRSQENKCSIVLYHRRPESLNAKYLKTMICKSTELVGKIYCTIKLRYIYPHWRRLKTISLNDVHMSVEESETGLVRYSGLEQGRVCDNNTVALYTS